jgi:hypothetical protein
MMLSMKRIGVGLAALFATLALSGRAAAGTLDLTSGGTGSFNGGIFTTNTVQPTGTGVIDSFLRLQNNGTESGYNTSARPVEFDQKTDPNFTRDLLLSSVPVVTINGTAYRQFLLDINEKNAYPGSLLSLDKLQIFQSPVGNINSYANLGTKVYDMGSGNAILLNYDLNSGSGSGDMFAYIPDSLFDPSVPYVYLYSAFGALANAGADAGFEEWAVLEGTQPPVNEVPGPATLLFAAVGCGLGLVGYSIRNRRKPTVKPV